MSRAGLVVLPLVTALVVGACRSDDCRETATCAAPSVISVQDAATGPRVYPEVPPPAGCDPAADAKTATACEDDAYALFVDPESGSDSAKGTKGAPLKSFAAASDNDRLAGRPRVYVCSSSGSAIGETLAPAPNVSVFGGFICRTWKHEGALSRIAPPAGYALHVADSPKGVTFSDLELVAPDAGEPGGSSIAVFAAAAKVTFRRVLMTAGVAKDGAAASPFATNVIDGPRDGNLGTQNGEARTCACASGSTTGGRGGDLNAAGASGSANPSSPATVPGADGAGGTANPCSSGRVGSDGVSKDPGPRAALGALTHDGWLPGVGSPGEAGDPGQGGGGGGGSAGAHGGGGACGGCGGAGGLGGKGGGASIALLAFQSDVHLDSCTLTPATAGNGSTGGVGEKGFSGGTGGSSTCSGGDGGAGAGGGGGGGGAGGLAAAVVRSGGTYDADVVTRAKSGTSGVPGVGGAGGPSAGGSGRAGKQGASGTSLPVPPTVVVL